MRWFFPAAVMTALATFTAASCQILNQETSQDPRDGKSLIVDLSWRRFVTAIVAAVFNRHHAVM
jgi:hypothetical protein